MIFVLSLQPADALAQQASLGEKTPTAPLICPTQQWLKRHYEKLDEIQNSGQIDLVFLGDSIFANFETDGVQPWMKIRAVWDKYYANRHAINLGSPGDTTSNVLWRIDHGELSGMSPKVVVLLIGTNNSLQGWKPKETEAGIDLVIEAIHRRQPRSKIILLSILPCARRPEWFVNANQEIDAYLAKKYVNHDWVVYCDATSIFKKEGRVNETLYLEAFNKPPSKPLHPNAFGMAKLADLLEPRLRSLSPP